MKYAISDAPTRVDESYVDGAVKVWLRGAQVQVTLTELSEDEVVLFMCNGVRQMLADKYAGPEKYPTLANRKARVREVLEGGISGGGESSIVRQVTTQHLAAALVSLHVGKPKDFGKMSTTEQWKYVGSAWCAVHAPSATAEEAVRRLAPAIQPGIDKAVAAYREAMSITVDLSAVAA
jgi:hypothetical protein